HEPLYLHSDNGNAMKAETLLITLYRLGVVPSRSRPRVSDDNAFIESFFKTLKYARIIRDTSPPWRKRINGWMPSSRGTTRNTSTQVLDM
ncbi:MAG: transposase family protein, partial [Microcoleus sp. SM1_3_4]|nr:transposase family protein [Microcoleus sp. SM1_3_4]